MNDPHPADANPVSADPVEYLITIAEAYVDARALHVIAHLGIADLLDEQPRTATELAERAGVQENALARAIPTQGEATILEAAI